MRILKVLVWFVLFCFLLSACSGTIPSPKSQSTSIPVPSELKVIARQVSTIDLGDFQSKAELTYPADGIGGNPTVILLHGSAAADMDYDCFSAYGDQELLSHNFKDIAEYLASRGFAVLRFNKHYVSGSQEVDWNSYAKNITYQQLLKDAEKVLGAAKSNSHVDPKRIFIYGWSEGTIIGAALAARHPELAGLILQAPPTGSVRGIVKKQLVNVGIPYLRTLAPDGLITGDTLGKAVMGTGGEIAKSGITWFSDPFYEGTGIAINKQLDTNKDGAISLNDEFLPAVDQLVNAEWDRITRNGDFYNLPFPAELAPELKLSVLILQGENDANGAGADDAVLVDQALEQAGNRDHQLKVYPGLGHSLGPASSLIGDNYRPIAQAPLEDTTVWLATHSH